LVTLLVAECCSAAVASAVVQTASAAASGARLPLAQARTHPLPPTDMNLDTFPTSEDLPLIQALLNTYTHSLNTGDRQAFEAQLLDTNIPFFGLPGHLPTDFAGDLSAVQNYPAFRRVVFESNDKFAQTFSNVRIDQNGDLAQVSLNFLTQRLPDGGAGVGWKVLHLLKVRGQWKIASEFYTVY